MKTEKSPAGAEKIWQQCVAESQGEVEQQEMNISAVGSHLCQKVFLLLYPKSSADTSMFSFILDTILFVNEHVHYLDGVRKGRSNLQVVKK